MVAILSRPQCIKIDICYTFPVHESSRTSYLKIDPVTYGLFTFWGLEFFDNKKENNIQLWHMYLTEINWDLDME